MRTSYFVSWLVSPHLKKPVSANEIYKPLWENAEDKKKQAKEDKKILLDEFANILDADKHFNPDKYGI